MYGRARTAQRAAQEVLTSSRTTTASAMPAAADSSNESELALRRQVSRLQRQLAEAQRELANKEDELSGEVEKRISAGTAYEELLDDQRRDRTRIEELSAFQARFAGIEQRLAESLANEKELATQLDRERDVGTALQVKLEEITEMFGEARVKWSEERVALDAEHAAELAKLDERNRSELEAATMSNAAATSRMREAHEHELEQLRGAHERSLATLRGELEPKALEAHGLAEERERLAGQLVTQKTEATRAATEREEVHKRSIAQLAWTNANELAALGRAHAVELAKVTAERDAKAAAHAEAVRVSGQREQLVEQTMSNLRDSQKRLQLELAEAKEQCARLESERASYEERILAAGREVLGLVDETRALRERADTSEAEVRRNAMDRLRFVAYLEEGLAMLGALPPKPDAHDDAEMTVTRDEPDKA